MKHRWWHWVFEKADGSDRAQIVGLNDAGGVILSFKLYNRCTLCGHRRVAHQWP